MSILSFKSKMHAVGNAVLDGIHESLERVSRSSKGLVIWQAQPPFCAGANLQELVEAAGSGQLNLVSEMVKKFQVASMMLKHSPVPVVSAAQGLALGGGCEFLMHSPVVVAAHETYMGLVEVGVGLLPAGAGCKEFALRASRSARNGDITAELKQGFENMAMGKVSTSAAEGLKLGYLKPTDRVILNPHELLHVAMNTVENMAESAWRADIPNQKFSVAGRPGIATLEMLLVNMAEGQFISEHEYLIAKKMATVLCGGEVEEGTLVDEEWILELEHKHFMELCETPKTQERVVHMLKTGKPLRN